MRASKAKKFSMNKNMLILPIPISFTHKRNTIKSIRKIQSKLDKMCHVLADISLIEESLTERVPTTSLIKEGRESRQYLKISILTLQIMLSFTNKLSTTTVTSTIKSRGGLVCHVWQGISRTGENLKAKAPTTALMKENKENRQYI